jgi:hypothetical protein
MVVRTAALAAVFQAAAIASCLAEVTRFELLSSDKPAFQGRTFGDHGTAENGMGARGVGNPFGRRRASVSRRPVHDR